MNALDNATPLSALDAVAVDTETTSLDARKARILQIAAVELRPRKGREARLFETLVDPGEPVPPASSAIHGITNELLAGAPEFPDAWAAFSGFVGSRVWIGHSVGFDLAVCRHEAQRSGLAWQQPRSLCLRVLGRLALPHLGDHSLDALAGWLDIAISGRHTAAGDARAAAAIFTGLVPVLAERGIRTLAEAERASLDRVPELEQHGRAGWDDPARRPETVPIYLKVDPHAYRHRVRDVMSAPPIILPASASAGEAVALMVERRISSVFVADNPSAASLVSDHGIVTERDMMRALAADGAGMLSRPLSGMMTRPLVSIAGEAFLYRAAARMQRLGIRHLAVRDEAGRLGGVVSARDLLRLRAGAAIGLEDELATAGDAAALAAAWARLPTVVDRLIAEQLDAPTIAAIASEELRVVTRRAVELAETAMAAEGLGRPPCPFAVMVLGSGGRGESLLAADQDNAIVFAEGAPDGPEDSWFAELGSRFAAILDAAGIPFCKGGVMARNAGWRGSVATWKARIDDWVLRSSPADLLNVDIFFDERAVHGETALARELFDHAFAAGRDQRHFPVLLGERIAQTGTPFTLLGGIRTQDGRIDLKRHGLFPIVSFARAVAIRHDLRHRGTRTRLEAAIAQEIGNADELRALLDAQALFLTLMLAQQSRDLAEGIPVSNKVATGGLGRDRTDALKRALSAVEKLPHLLQGLLGR